MQRSEVPRRAALIHTAASHLGVIKMLWLHFRGAVMLSNFMPTVWTGDRHPQSHVAFKNLHSKQSYLLSSTCQRGKMKKALIFSFIFNSGGDNTVHVDV